jgi:hypothetical protein
MRKILFALALPLLFCIQASSQIRYDDGGLSASGLERNQFSVQGNSWNDRIIRYFFQNTTSDINQAVARQQVRDAFALWQAQARLYFIEVCSATDADIVIFWGTGNHGDASSFDGLNGVLAHAYFPPPNGGAIAGDIHFDDDETWTELQRANGTQPIDLFTVALHEIGHSLGLNHTNISGAIMEGTYVGSRRQLAQDDIDGIRSIYGAPAAMINGASLVCSAENYSLNETLPTGVSVTYTVQQFGSVVSLTQSGNTATLTRISNGSVALIATLTTACDTLTFTRVINVGPPSGIGIVSYDNLSPCEDDGYFQVLPPNPPGFYYYSGSLTVTATGASTISWALAPGTTANGWSYSSSGGTVTVSTKQHYSSVRLRVTVTNSCGSTYKDYVFSSTQCLFFSRVASPSYTLSPNPTKGVFTITLNGPDKGAAIKEVIVNNKMGVAVRRLTFKNGRKVQTVNLQGLPPDLYFLQIFDGNTWTGERILKE